MYRLIALIIGMLVLVSPGRADEPQVVEIEVTGMTCPFCVYGTEKKLTDLPGVDKAEVSLKAKKARIVMTPGKKADIETIRQAITEAGFTPGDVTVNTATESQ